jgi:hypothetical protein
MQKQTGKSLEIMEMQGKGWPDGEIQSLRIPSLARQRVTTNRSPGFN